MSIDESRFQALIGGELDEAAAAELVRELQADEEGRGLLELHELLLRGGPRTPDPSGDEFRRMRGDVLETIRRERRSVVTAFPRRTVARRAWLAVAASAAVVLLPLAGFVAGRSTLAPAPGPVAAGALPEAVHQAALRQPDPRSVEDSPYVFSDVRVSEVGDGNLALAFNLTQHVELVRPRHDPLVTEVLVQSLLPSATLATRLAALDHVEARMDDRMRDALVRAMLHDPQLAVRQAALERLAPLDADPAVQDALLAVLERDESVHMRLLAIDHLQPDRLGADTLDRILSSTPESQARPLEVRAMNRLASRQF